LDWERSGRVSVLQREGRALLAEICEKEGCRSSLFEPGTAKRVQALHGWGNLNIPNLQRGERSGRKELASSTFPKIRLRLAWSLAGIGGGGGVFGIGGWLSFVFLSRDGVRCVAVGWRCACVVPRFDSWLGFPS